MWDRGPEGAVLVVPVVDVLCDGVFEGGELCMEMFLELGLTSCGYRGSGSFGFETKSNVYHEMGAELCFDGMFEVVEGVGLGRS